MLFRILSNVCESREVLGAMARSCWRSQNATIHVHISRMCQNMPCCCALAHLGAKTPLRHSFCIMFLEFVGVQKSEIVFLASSILSRLQFVNSSLEQSDPS